VPLRDAKYARFGQRLPTAGCQARTVTQAVLRRESWTAQWGRGPPTAPLLPGGRQRL